LNKRQARIIRLILIQEWFNFNTGKCMRDDLSDEALDLLPTVSTPGSMITFLSHFATVSEIYSIDNLKVDFWFIFKEDHAFTNAQKSFQSQLQDPIMLLQYQILLRAFADLRSDRPCDYGLWRCDSSPDYLACRKDYHRCGADAENYLLRFSVSCPECLVGLSDGSIEGMVITINRAKKKNLLSQALSLLNFSSCEI